MTEDHDATPTPLVGVRFLVVRGMPLVAIDLIDAPVGRPELDGGLFQLVVERGLVVLPGFFDVDLPRGARIGFTLRGAAMILEDDTERTLLELPREAVDVDWTVEAKRMRGTMALVGHRLGLTAEDEPGDVAGKLDVGARDGRVCGAIVGVAEPAMGLPLLFG